MIKPLSEAPIITMKKSLLVPVLSLVTLLALFVAPSRALAAPADFITKWETTTPSQTITIPTLGGGYFYDVNWGDSVTEFGFLGDASHVYASPGIYTVTISGTFPRIYFADSGSHPELVEINQWGTGTWNSMDHAFWGATSLIVTATDIPDLSGVTSTAFMFHGTTALTSVPNINSWNVSTVTDMTNMFAISSFNSDIGSWNVANVTDMTEMFYGNESFNQDISGWNMSHVIAVPEMFYGATTFNQDISSWNVSSITDMGSFFTYAIAFNQNLGSWDVSSVTDMTDIFSNTALSVGNYDAILSGWALQTLQTGVTFNADGIKYCAASQARNTIVSVFSWTITDAGILNASCAFTQTPTIYEPLGNSSHYQDSPLTVSFLLPESITTNSINLLFIPTSGPTITLNLRDAASSIVNTFSLPLTGGFSSTTEVLSASASEIPVGTYTVVLSYQDSIGNPAATATATNVSITPPPTGTLHFHIFTDNDGNGTQSDWEVNNFSDATLTLTHGSESEEVHFDSSGTIDSEIAIGVYTLLVNIPTGYSLTGGSNNFSVTITTGLTTNAGIRGVTTNNSGSSGGGGSSSVVFGGGSYSVGGSSSSYSSSSSSSSSSDSGLRSSSTATTTTANDLPTRQPHDPACLASGSSSISFSDVQNNIDINYLTALTFSGASAQHLIHGYDAQHFGPTNQLTRFELLKIAMASNCVWGGNGSNFTHTNIHFSDVPQDDSEQSKIIGEAYSRGIVTGIGDHFFPNAPVSYAEMIKMLLTSSAYFSQGAPNSILTLNLTNIPDPTFGQPLEYARRLSILPTTFIPTAQVTRAEMAELLAKYIRAMSSTVIIS